MQHCRRADSTILARLKNAMNKVEVNLCRRECQTLHDELVNRDLDQHTFDTQAQEF